ncbi:hypothetical protein IEQ34_012850 [Dendrobium chrysotoxum]|uniref:RRM domain-containing protein n=1 Tax=Dendrobium chrysotoxum TaxID=161865 RepID=A0AAV7GPV1_DENCH|nr:hypothetical protein IEQ34_012850 [Dendrobium chrysotoxum]
MEDLEASMGADLPWGRRPAKSRARGSMFFLCLILSSHCWSWVKEEDSNLMDVEVVFKRQEATATLICRWGGWRIQQSSRGLEEDSQSEPSLVLAVISLRKGNAQLSSEVNRVLYVRNLPFNISSEEMYDIFRKYGFDFVVDYGTGLMLWIL